MNDAASSEPKDMAIHLDKELLDSAIVCKNISQEILVITVDKAKLCLIEHQSILKAQRDWIAPAGILLALITSLVAADFKDFLMLKAEVWQAIFIILSIACGIWLVMALLCAYRNRGKGQVDELIEKLKESPSEMKLGV